VSVAGANIKVEIRLLKDVIEVATKAAGNASVSSDMDQLG
jgi:hypothetical protein